VRRELQNSLNLFPRNTEFFDQIVNTHILEVLEHSRNWSPRSSEYQRAASLSRNAFHGWTLRPIESSHILSLLTLNLNFYHELTA
jgi:hypothetical protein